MTQVKKKIFIIIKSVFAILVFLTLVLFIYAAFFFDRSSVEKKTFVSLENEEVEKEKIEEDEILKEKDQLVKEAEEKLKAQSSIKQIKTTLKDGLFAIVGNKAITQSDVANEIKTILILNNMSYTDENKADLQQMAIKAAVKRNIKDIEIEKYDLQFNQNDLDNHIKALASNANMDLPTLQDICEVNGLDFSIIEDQVKTELLWNSLIFSLYRSRISINLEEIDEQLKLNQGKEEFQEFLISEIILKAVEKDKLEAKLQEIKNKIETEGFENVARNLSISQSAMKGGDLGWLNENQISKTFKPLISKTPVGGVTEPILIKENILIFKVRNRKTVQKEVNLEELKDQLVNSEKNKILNMYSLSHYDNLRRLVSIKFLNE